MSKIVEKKWIDVNGIKVRGLKFEDGTVAVRIKKLCEELGLDWEGQRQRINRCEVCSSGTFKIKVATNGGKQNETVLSYKYLPFFLTGIKSNMINNKDVSEKLLDFKLKVVKVLEREFITIEDDNTPLTEEIEILKEDNEKLEKQNELLSKFVDGIGIDIDTLSEITDVEDILVIKEIARHKLKGDSTIIEYVDMNNRSFTRMEVK